MLFKTIVGTVLMAEATAHFTADKTCKDQWVLIDDVPVEATFSSKAAPGALSLEADVKTVVMVIQERDSSNTWGSTCQSTKVDWTDDADKYVGTYTDQSYYWWIPFFNYWVSVRGVIGCPDKKNTKCYLNTSVDNTTFDSDSS